MNLRLGEQKFYGHQNSYHHERLETTNWPIFGNYFFSLSLSVLETFENCARMSLSKSRTAPQSLELRTFAITNKLKLCSFVFNFFGRILFFNFYKRDPVDFS